MANSNQDDIITDSTVMDYSEYNMKASFRHEILPGIFDWVRTVTVLPGLSSGFIQCQIETVQIPATYKCLSYVCGPDTPCHDILLNGQRFQVHHNLWGFLNLARRRFADQPLWIDAICINQKDIPEKNEQVQQMGQIYKTAGQVLSWLGPDLVLDKLFAFTRVAYDHPSKRRILAWSSDSKIKQLELSKLDKVAITPKRLNGYVKGMQVLCRVEYWKRAWIAQEILLATEIRLLSLNDEMDWDKFVTALNWFKDPTYPGKYDVEQIAMTRGRRGHFDRHQTMCEMLGKMQKECYNPRDRIYSLRATVPDGDAFEVDYNEDTLSLFWRAGNHFSAWTDPNNLGNLASALNITSAQLENLNFPSQPQWPITARIEALRAPDIRNESVGGCFGPRSGSKRGRSLFCKHCTFIQNVSADFKVWPNDLVACFPGGLDTAQRHAMFRREANGCYRTIKLPLDDAPMRKPNQPSIHDLEGAALLERQEEGWKRVNAPLAEPQCGKMQLGMEIAFDFVLSTLRAEEAYRNRS